MKKRRLAGFAMVGSLAVVSWSGASAQATDGLPSLWKDPVKSLPATLPEPYVLVARPFYGTRSDGVDVVTFDPVTLRPLTRSPTSLQCNRIGIASSGAILCYTIDLPGNTHKYGHAAFYFYSKTLSLMQQVSPDVKGRPSRARLSSDGKYGAATLFTSGDSYVQTGVAAFSTVTLLVPADGREAASNLQDWAVIHHDKPVDAIDLNVWGVTFDPRNSGIVYATVAFGGRSYLARGEIDKHRLTVIKGDVECPSVSPDGKRIAFKRRTGAASWSPAVLDLATLEEKVFDVGHSVDDQIEWLDDHVLLYEVVTGPAFAAKKSALVTLDVSQAAAMESAWLSGALSPAVHRKQN